MPRRKREITRSGVHTLCAVRPLCKPWGTSSRQSCLNPSKVNPMTKSRHQASSHSPPSARDIRGPSPLIALTDEPPPKLIVDPPLPEALSQGRVFIQYRTENLRIVPVFGQGALAVSPRIGHIHITVDYAPWHFVDASGETIIVVGLPPGPHQVLIELADPTHRIITSETVRFIIPG